MAFVLWRPVDGPKLQMATLFGRPCFRSWAIRRNFTAAWGGVQEQGHVNNVSCRMMGPSTQVWHASWGRTVGGVWSGLTGETLRTRGARHEEHKVRRYHRRSAVVWGVAPRTHGKSCVALYIHEYQGGGHD
jgi:hypothetical protein